MKPFSCLRAYIALQRIALALLLSTALATPAGAKQKAPDPAMARIWSPMGMVVKRVDGKKPKFHIDQLEIAPGEHEVRFETVFSQPTFTSYTAYVVRATFVRGHTYAWTFDTTRLLPAFHDLGEGFVVPKLGWLSASPEYLQAVQDASLAPEQPVTFIPKDQWDR